MQCCYSQFKVVYSQFQVRIAHKDVCTHNVKDALTHNVKEAFTHNVKDVLLTRMAYSQQFGLRAISRMVFITVLPLGNFNDVITVTKRSSQPTMLIFKKTQFKH